MACRGSLKLLCCSLRTDLGWRQDFIRSSQPSLRACRVVNARIGLFTCLPYRQCYAASTMTRGHGSHLFEYIRRVGCKSSLFPPWCPSRVGLTASRYNDNVRHAERRRVFNVNELKRLAVESVSRNLQELESFEKLAEGGFNRSFLVTLRDGFRFVARIPYLVTAPKYFTVASEVATVDYLRAHGLPIPRVYGYSTSPDNPAGTEYIFM